MQDDPDLYEQAFTISNSSFLIKLTIYLNLILKHLPLFLLLIFSCDKVPSPALTADEELATFEIAPGYKIELVASDPMIQDPIVIRFDEDGRLWVVEMRGFMTDIDGTNENAPVGRVSILFDRDQDGRMDSSKVFVDSLVLPRALAIVKGGALVAEDATLWYMEDTDNDLKADKRTLIDPDYGNKGVVEHSANGLWRGMDNWIYNAKSKFRYRQVDGTWVKEETEFRGQWGICHDNSGKLYYNYNWSQLHMDLVPPNYLMRNPHHRPTSGIDYILSQDRRVFPIRPNRAINRGYVEGTLDAEGKIIEFASACAPFIYRGDLFESGAVGDAFVCEPTGNLVKRNTIKWDSIYPVAENAYPGKEFLASADERFRPVWLESGPDGALYIADMYRGIIQHGPYMSPYLREITIERKLDKPVNLGRIWRIVPDNSDNIRPPLKLSGLSIPELVELLQHRNGWYRDIAQRVLIDREDTTAMALLHETLSKSQNHLARLHALWTLEGLGNSETGIYLEALSDPDNEVKAVALQLLEKAAATDPERSLQLEQALQDPLLPLPDLQRALTAGTVRNPIRQKLLLEILSEHSESQLFKDAIMSSIGNHEYEFLLSLLDQPDWQQYSGQKEIMVEQLASSIALKGNPEELTGLLQLLNQDDLSWKQLAILNGLSLHSLPADSSGVELPQTPELFSRKFMDDELQIKVSKVAALFNWPGKESLSGLTQDEVSFDINPEILTRGRSLYLTICAGCHGNDGKGMTRFAPPLANSEWVLGQPERLARILLHGMEGPVEVNGRVYDVPEILPVMPAFATTPPEDLAAIMTYIRQEWGHNVSPVKPATVGQIRVLNQGKVKPWTAEELLEEYSTSNHE